MISLFQMEEWMAFISGIWYFVVFIIGVRSRVITKVMLVIFDSMSTYMDDE